jgi:Predicted integral membrane protein
MDCDKALEMMSLYIDLELNKEEQEKLFEHIDCCEQCRQEFEMLKDIVGTLNKEEFLPLPCDYHEELMAKVNDIKIENVNFGKNGKDNRKKWKKYGSIAAAAVLVISVSAFVRNMNFNAYTQNETTELTEAQSSEYNGKDQRSMSVSEEAESNEYAMDEEKIMPMDFGTAAGDVSNDEVDLKEVNSNVEERKK